VVKTGKPAKASKAAKTSKAGKASKAEKVSEPAKPEKVGKSAKAGKNRKDGSPGRAAAVPPPSPATSVAADPSPAGSVADVPSRRTRPPGQRLYDMPYSAVAPRMVNPELGLSNLVARSGNNEAYEIDVTLLDAPDHRLIRSGVLLAHRVLDGRGEWYLSAPDWQPLLPKDRIELMGHADLPEELADLIRPLRRRAALGPVAALNCDRREFALRDTAGATLALLRDDRVTVRRGGLTTARYREVMLTPVGAGLTEDQTAWLDRALLGVGSTQVPRFARLVSRLGAPATGATDIPEDVSFDPAAPLRHFVAQLLGLRLRRLVEADLAVRGGDGAAGARLVEQARLLLTELRGLGRVAPGDWLDDLADELVWLTGPAADGIGGPLPARLRSERYLALLDRLVAASRAPKLGGPAAQPAGEVADALLAAAVQGVARAVAAVAERSGEADADEESADGDAAAWEDVHQAVAVVENALAFGAHVRPQEAAALAARLTRSRRALSRAATRQLSEQAALDRAAASSAREAFAAGREFERQTVEIRRAREEFLHAWNRAHHKLRKAPS